MPTTVTNRFLRKELDNFEKTKDMDCIYGELKYSALIVAKNGTEYTTVNVDGNEFIQVFTDIHEYQKMKLSLEFQPKAYYFNFYIELLQKGYPGFIINPNSERFMIARDILDVMDTDYLSELDYQPLTFKETLEIYDSIDNRELQEFMNNDSWDLHNLMEILLKSDLLTLINSEKPLEEIDSTGVYDCIGEVSFQSIENYALIFSKPLIGHNHRNSYSQLVNLPLFIEEALKNDLSGIMLNNYTVLPRKFLIEFMKTFKNPCPDDYSDFAFSLGDDKQ